MIRLAIERRLRGLSQADLADKARISRSNLSMIENGKLEPYPVWKERIAAALGYTIDQVPWLFEEVQSGGTADQRPRSSEAVGNPA